MGEQEVQSELDQEQMRGFMKALLDDVHALEMILERGMLETGKRRIGAEQEVFLIDDACRPSLRAQEILKAANDPRLTTELALFNLEANLSPLEFGGDCLGRMERELDELMGVLRAAARSEGADAVLAGILPTLRKSDLGMESMTPAPRYRELNAAMQRLRGGDFHVMLKGVDELDLHHDNVMLEACNTSFQVHFQVDPEEFPRFHNLAQAVTAPVLAAAVNSPLLLGRRLWRETRIALFQHSVDTRSSPERARETRPRVNFGDRWVDASVLEIFREDIARFRVVLAGALDQENPVELVERGVLPELSALRMHTGTVYRWNRACYGVVEGVGHLRIENRALPAGPTILDEVSNAAFYFGLMSALNEEYGDIASLMDFDDAKQNFFAVSRHGLDARLTWIAGRTWPACQLIEEHLLPMARQGLAAAGIDAGDIDRYLGVVEARVAARATGAQWALDSISEMRRQDPDSSVEACMRALVSTMRDNQVEGKPVHEWNAATLETLEILRDNYQTVDQFMSTDLRTVHPEDLVDLAASLMDWEKIRYLPVEDDGALVGLVSNRQLLRLVARRGSAESVSVREIMRADPVSISPQTSTLEAMRSMRANRVGCLPVVENGHLVGLVTEQGLADISVRLLEAFLHEH
jgi:CBS domain-containing protein